MESSDITSGNTDKTLREIYKKTETFKPNAKKNLKPYNRELLELADKSLKPIELPPKVFREYKPQTNMPPIEQPQKPKLTRQEEKKIIRRKLLEKIAELDSEDNEDH